MKNIALVIWMVGFPLACSVDRFVNRYLLGNSYSDNTLTMSAFVVLFIWIFVGIKLYEKKEEK